MLARCRSEPLKENDPASSLVFSFSYGCSLTDPARGDDRLTGLSVGSWFLDDARSFVRCGMGQRDCPLVPFRHTVWDKGTVPLSHPCPIYTRRAPWRGLFSLARVSVAFWLVGAVGASAGAAACGIGARAATRAGATAAAVVGTAARGPAAGADDQVHRLAGVKFGSA